MIRSLRNAEETFCTSPVHKNRRLKYLVPPWHLNLLYQKRLEVLYVIA